MPLSPHFERFTLVDEGRSVEVALIAAHRFGDREIALLVPADADEQPGDETDAYIRERVPAEEGDELVEIDDDALVDEAWDYFESQLELGEEEAQGGGA